MASTCSDRSSSGFPQIAKIPSRRRPLWRKKRADVRAVRDDDPFPGTVDFDPREKNMGGTLPWDGVRSPAIGWFPPAYGRKCLVRMGRCPREEIPERTQGVWDSFYSLREIWSRSKCVLRCADGSRSCLSPSCIARCTRTRAFRPIAPGVRRRRVGAGWRCRARSCSKRSRCPSRSRPCRSLRGWLRLRIEGRGERSFAVASGSPWISLLILIHIRSRAGGRTIAYPNLCTARDYPMVGRRPSVESRIACKAFCLARANGRSMRIMNCSDNLRPEFQAGPGKEECNFS